MRVPSVRKLNFSYFFERLIGIDLIKIDGVLVKYNKVKELTNHFLFVFAFSSYVVIAYGYWKAGYSFLIGVTTISLLILVVLFLLKRQKQVSANLAGVLFIYIPIANILIKDVFFLYKVNPLINTIFLHTHFMLLLFIAFGGLITKRRHILIVGSISVVWIWIFTIYCNDPFLWSLVNLDTVFFVGISLIMYFVYSSINNLVIEFDRLGRTINHQNKELNILLEFKGKMLNMIVHDIKNPINSILSASNMEVIQKAEIIKPSKQILLIVENILDVYKMEDSKMSLKLSIHTLDDIIQKAIEQVSYLLDQKNISIIKRITINPEIEVDENLIERVVVNLLNNAIKYSKLNSRIDICIQPGKDTVRVRIIDNGEGIATDNINHIFEKYYQSTKGLAHPHSTGMGLTFCKLVIETHGGTIGAESILNQGTTIWFELPVKLENEMISELTTKSSPKRYENITTENKIILDFKLKIADMAIYQTGEIFHIFKTSIYDNSPGFVYWKEEIIKASMAGNHEYFNQLKEIPTDRGIE